MDEKPEVIVQAQPDNNIETNAVLSGEVDITKKKGKQTTTSPSVRPQSSYM